MVGILQAIRISVVTLAICVALFQQGRLLTKLYSSASFNHETDDDAAPHRNSFQPTIRWVGDELRTAVPRGTNKSLEQRMTIIINNNNNKIESSYHHTAALPPPSPPIRKWAYAFLIGGCDSTKPQYKGFLLNTLVAAYKLRTTGSQADIIVLIQMSSYSNEERLPDDDVSLLNAMNIQIRYLPKFKSHVSETFYALVMEKFRILELVDYSRVLFLDSDIMPHCSLDYMFELSEPPPQPSAEKADDRTDRPEPILKETVILSWHGEAANAGFFMVKPGLDEFRAVQEIIRAKEERALAMPFPHWDPIEGWGHVFHNHEEEGEDDNNNHNNNITDYWRSEDGTNGTIWKWHAVFADQGLLYYWAKYFKRNASIIIGRDVENWGSTTDRSGTDDKKKVILEKTYYDILTNYTCRAGATNAYVPYQDFKHFTGTKVCFAKILI